MYEPWFELVHPNSYLQRALYKIQINRIIRITYSRYNEYNSTEDEFQQQKFIALAERGFYDG